MSASESCKESKLIDDDVCGDVNNMLENMSADDNDIILICANCGKEGAKNTCNKCKQVKYCNAVCKKKHKKKHKKDCEEHLRLAAEKHDIELFKQPPPQYGDCPICFIRIPTLETGYRYQSCCGKLICSGCAHAPVYDNQGNVVAEKICPFCRTPKPYTDEEKVERLKKLVEKNGPSAIYNLGCDYRDGSWGYPKDHTKALELFHQAAELGYVEAYCCIGCAYENGTGVEVDEEKAKHYYELAALKGCMYSRHNLGLVEEKAGNMDRALKHWMIAVRSGYSKSLNEIKELYSNRHASKEDYTKSLQSYQAYLGEIKSPQRDTAAAARKDYRYY